MPITNNQIIKFNQTALEKYYDTIQKISYIL